MSTLPFDAALLSAELREEAASTSNWSTSRQIAAVFESIDDAIKRGVTRARVLELLANKGVTVSMRQLDKCLYRERKRRREAASAQPPTPTQKPVQSDSQAGNRSSAPADTRPAASPLMNAPLARSGLADPPPPPSASGQRRPHG